jgi:glycosyltransferase involved in cell wall biosynthesis
MTTLRVIIEEVLSPVPNGISRYSNDLTRALVATAPHGTKVEGIVAASTEAEYEDLHDRFPGITLFKSTFARRELIAGWQHGFTRLPGIVHAPSLLAPLSRHDRLHNDHQQTVVTLHDVTAWVDPDSVESRGAAWHIAMAKRAHRYADALVVPTHAVADQLTEFLDFGDRVRVIGGAVSTALRVPADADQRAAKLDLPDHYLLAFGGLEARRGLSSLLAALSMSETDDVPLLVVGPDDDTIEAAAAEMGLEPGRVRSVGRLIDSDLSVVIDRALALVLPSQLEGFGLSLLEAFHFGTPVIHSDSPALVETAGGAGLVVHLGEDDFIEQLASAIGKVASDDALARTLSVAGRDRAGLFNWETSAEKVWQLHADL